MIAVAVKNILTRLDTEGTYQATTDGTAPTIVVQGIDTTDVGVPILPRSGIESDNSLYVLWPDIACDNTPDKQDDSLNCILTLSIFARVSLYNQGTGLTIAETIKARLDNFRPTEDTKYFRLRRILDLIDRSGDWWQTTLQYTMRI